MFESRNRPFAPALAAVLAGIALGGCHASTGRTRVAAAADGSRIREFQHQPRDAVLDVPYPFDLFSRSRTLRWTARSTCPPCRGARCDAAGAELRSTAGRRPRRSTRASRCRIDPASISGSSVKIVKLWLDPTTKAPADQPGLPADGRDEPGRRRPDLRHRLHRRRLAGRRRRRQDPADHAAQAARLQHRPGRQRQRPERRQGPERRLPRGPDQRPEGDRAAQPCGPTRSTQRSSRRRPIAARSPMRR